MDVKEQILKIGEDALAASRALAKLSTRKKNAILEAMAEELDAQRAFIQAENTKDLEAGKEAGLNVAMLDRLELTDARIDGMIKGLRDVAVLSDPVGNEISTWNRPNGLEIRKIRVPIGVIGIIFESRPNVTCDAAALCFKTSNAVILRGGKEAIHSNLAIAKAMQNGGKAKGMPDNAIQLIPTTDREAVKVMCQMTDYLDLIIPRGGEGLIKAVTEMSHVPVIKHYKGICHTYIDAAADLPMGWKIAENAKCQRPGVCNAMETLLVHKDKAAEFLPKMGEILEARGVELRGDETVCRYIASAKPATEEDWHEEYLEMILAIRVVDDVDAAVAHINKYGSGHSDAIVTQDEKAEKTFLAEVDSSSVYVNASTRFTDGAEFGMGAEIGISTDKLHARGPMGLEELTTYKFVIEGKGQIRE
ncbi:glutamate-5-semialdehyde dehydrogenase [Pontiella sulfatireligans]|uniref:Gamma-glutamyl phosphate reductase n=1 Tax=Pontiella sulfatireligans TaxID=2750658 RepID=A0A6C2URJ2_9BACT|nr:glutamate-5-semialdehyde dehydrogenase [Pontiella sulfatireligans]VGO21847.1 Gamma-glutamyl phosphate reductase [Pontiella sulfatireligans]